MKNTLIALSLISATVFGQSKIEKLPLFFDESNENRLYSVDMEGEGKELIVLYTTYNDKDVKCKQWNGQSWVDFGVFPQIKVPGRVNLELFEGNAYALHQGARGWSIYQKKKDSENWNLYGEERFAGTIELTNPQLIFVEGEPIVYEQDDRTDKMIMYKCQKGKYYSMEKLSALPNVSGDFAMVSKKEDHVVMGWTSTNGKEMQLHRQDGDNSASLKNGLKTTDIKEIKDLLYNNEKLNMYYFDNNWSFQAVEFNEKKEKWEKISLKEKIGDLGFHKATDLSFVSMNRQSNLPVFYKYNGVNWDKGITIGNETIMPDKLVKLEESQGVYYLLQTNLSGKVMIQKFK